MDTRRVESMNKRTLPGFSYVAPGASRGNTGTIRRYASDCDGGCGGQCLSGCKDDCVTVSK